MFKTLREDIAAVKQRDPACTGSVSALLHYPGLQALRVHRAGHWLWRHHLRFCARTLSQMTRFFTGVEIHPGAQIGRGVFIDHGMGVVIGETSIVGDRVTLYQGVTLGGTGKASGKRHPTLEDGVVVGVGAAVLGDIVIGENARVGGGAVVVKDVPCDATVVGVPGKIVRRDGQVPRACMDLIDDARIREDLPDPTLEILTELAQRITHLERALGALDQEEHHDAEDL
ncbi:MAG: serine O-acetyltransferase [Actinomycetia bacterium]|nr:serine O-acetyltransferase [Actinomycetes bacterium]